MPARVPSNPFKGLTVDDDSDPDEKRDPFTPEQLKTIFDGAPWSTCDQVPGGHPSRYWVPLICLYHGLRRGEPSGMLLEKIIEIDGVPVFDLKPNRLRRLKNKPSRRQLPIHLELIRLGFLDYVARQRAAGQVQLFPETTPNASGHYGDNVSDWFSRLCAPAKASEFDETRRVVGLLVRGLRKSGPED